MSDIEELEGRILAALDRIGDSVAQLPEEGMIPAEPVAAMVAEPEEASHDYDAAPAVPDAQPSAPVEGGVEAGSEREAELAALLEDERLTNAQLEERVKALKARQDEMIDGLKAQLEEMRSQAAETQDASERLRHVNADLRDINARLREQLMSNTAEPHLINRAMMAEIEALRATRAADMAEVQAVMQELRPLITEEVE